MRTLKRANQWMSLVCTCRSRELIDQGDTVPCRSTPTFGMLVDANGRYGRHPAMQYFLLMEPSTAFRWFTNNQNNPRWVIACASHKQRPRIVTSPDFRDRQRIRIELSLWSRHGRPPWGGGPMCGLRLLQASGNIVVDGDMDLVLVARRLARVLGE
jgi:hypothetical protein